MVAVRPHGTLPRRMAEASAGRGVAATPAAASRAASPRAATPPPPAPFGAPLLSFATRLFRAPGAAQAERAASPARAASASVASAAAAAAEPRHLFFLVHGLSGRPEDLSSLREALLTRSGGTAAVHLARANVARGGSTHDGIEGARPHCLRICLPPDSLTRLRWCAAGAARLVDELRSVVAARPSLTHLSLVGNSLGGLYCRYAAALALEPPADGGAQREPTVAGLRPVTFLTTATPHLGVGAFGYLGLLPPWLQAGVGGRAMGRTIAQLLLQDATHPGGCAPLFLFFGGCSHQRIRVPLLVRMASPDESSASSLPFMRALGAFKRRIAYANAANDLLVAYETAAILPPGCGVMPAAEVARSLGPLPLPALGGAPRVLHTRERPATPLASRAEALADDRHALQRRMASGLGTLSWVETAVLFPGPLPNAHNKIVALRRDPLMTWMYREGAQVVEHTADALLAEAARAEAEDVLLTPPLVQAAMNATN